MTKTPKSHSQERPTASMGALALVAGVFMVSGVVNPSLAHEAGPSSAKWRETRRIEVVAEVSAALELFHDKYGRYPNTDSQWRGDCGTFGGFGYDADGYIPELVPEFLESLPRDPDPRYPFFNAGCAYKSDGADYKFLLFHTPETFPEDNEHEDLMRPFWAWQVSSIGGAGW